MESALRCECGRTASTSATVFKRCEKCGAWLCDECAFVTATPQKNVYCSPCMEAYYDYYWSRSYGEEA